MSLRDPMPGSRFSEPFLRDALGSAIERQTDGEMVLAPTQKQVIAASGSVQFHQMFMGALHLPVVVHPLAPEGRILLIGRCVRCDGKGSIPSSPDWTPADEATGFPVSKCDRCRGTGRSSMSVRVAEPGDPIYHGNRPPEGWVEERGVCPRCVGDDCPGRFDLIDCPVLIDGRTARAEARIVLRRWLADLPESRPLDPQPAEGKFPKSVQTP